MQFKRFIFGLTAILAMLVGLQQPLAAAKKPKCCKQIRKQLEQDRQRQKCATLPSKPHKQSLWVNQEEELIFTDKNCTPHAVCVDCPRENEITGWWLNTIKGNLTGNTVLWHIRYVGDELKAKVYAGYQGRYREWTPEDYIPALRATGFFVNFGFIPIDDFVLQPRAPGSWIMNPLATNSPEYFSPIQNELWLNLSQTDPNILYPVGFDTMRLVRLAEAPEIETFDNPSFIDNTNPIKIFDNIYNILLLNGNPQFSTDVQASDYPGFLAFTAHKDQLLATGALYDSEVKDVWRTRTDFPTGFNFPLSTTFITVQPPNPRIGGRAIVSGFLPPYDILNNSDGWEIGIADNENGRNASEVYGPSYYDGADEKFMLTVLDIDTSSLPAYDPQEHGVGQITVVVPPVTAATEYRELIAAVHDLESFADRSTHTTMYGFIDRTNLRLFPTFADLQIGFDTGTATTRGFPFVSRGYNGTRSGALYVDIDRANGSSAPAIPSNDPTGYVQGAGTGTITLYDAPSPTAFYSIDVFNYLDPERTYNMYWALTGAPIPGSPITTQKLVDDTGGYYKTPGSQFIFTVDNYYNNYIFGNTPPDPAVWSIYNKGSFDDFNNLIFGIIDPAKTCGETVAYISFLSCTGIDPLFGASTFPEFASNSGADPLSDCLALMMETLNQYNPTSYIINWRGNEGGSTQFFTTLGAFFGENRPGFEPTKSFADNGNRPGISLQEIDTDAQFGLQEYLDYFKIIDTDLIASLYPNAIVRTPGTKVFFLTDTNAASAGDFVPHAFRNNDAGTPGDLGSGITSYIVGDIDGRLFASGGPGMRLFTNLSHNLFLGEIPFSAIVPTVERAVNFARLGDNPYIFGNQTPVVAPDLLVNMDIESTFWLDVGAQGTYPKNPVDGGTDPLVLPLSTGVTQPVYGNTFAEQATWRDRTLEACLMMAIPEGCFSDRVRDVKREQKVKAHKAKLAKHLVKRSKQGPNPERVPMHELKLKM